MASLMPTIAEKIIGHIRLLADNPRPNGCKKLVGAEHTYRIRINDYRAVYSLFDQRLVIEVIKIGHRKNVYR